MTRNTAGVIIQPRTVVAAAAAAPLVIDVLTVVAAPRVVVVVVALHLHLVAVSVVVNDEELFLGIVLVFLPVGLLLLFLLLRRALLLEQPVHLLIHLIFVRGPPAKSVDREPITRLLNHVAKRYGSPPEN
jgi:hypothetical protein